MTLKLWPLLQYQIRNIMEKPCQKCAPKASPRRFFYFGKQPKTAIACKNFFQKKDILKGIIKNL